MENSKETPIAKYLANLERRKSMFTATASPSLTPGGFPYISTVRRAPPGTQMKINFDDTFFSTNENESILHISPEPSSAGIKKRRMSVLHDEREDVEPLQKKIADLERLLRQTQNELVDRQAACTKLDQVNIETRRTCNEKVLALENSNEAMNLKCKNATERAESLEKQLLKVQRKDADSTRDSQMQLTTQLNKIATLEATVAALQTKNQEQALQLTESSIGGEQTIQRMQLQLSEAEKLCAKFKQDAEVAQSQLTELQSQLQKSHIELKEAQTEAVRNEAFRKEYEAARAAQESSNSDMIQLQERLHRMENLFVKEQVTSQNMAKQFGKLQNENSILKTTVQREHLLKEQMMSAESEISVLKRQLREKADVEGDRNNLRSQVKAWIAVATKLDTSCRTPLDFDSTFRKAQDLLLQLKLENSNLKHTTESNARQMSSMELEAQKANDQIKTLSAEKDKLNLDFTRLTRRMQFIVQDRNSCRAMMESYEKDFDDGLAGSELKPLRTRISQLETIVGEYEATLAEDPSLRKSCQECDHYATAIDSLQTQLESIRSDNETLSRTLSEVNQTVTEDPTTGIKIVSFGMNPSMLSIEGRLKECIAENESLKAKLRAYEEDTMVAIPDGELLKEKKDLEERFKTLERRHELLTDSYDYETVQLQNACTKLFGYHITLNRGGAENPNQFKLQSVYSNAHDPDDTFIFQEGNGGDMLLLDTPILVHFQDDIERFLRQECSVPAFLSAVTISYTQGAHPSMNQSSVDAAGYDENSNSNGEGDNEETIQILATESLSGFQPSRQVEVEIEVEGEEEDELEDESEDDEEFYEEDEGEEVDYVDDDRDDEAEYDPEDDDDVVQID